MGLLRYNVRNCRSMYVPPIIPNPTRIFKFSYIENRITDLTQIVVTFLNRISCNKAIFLTIIYDIIISLCDYTVTNIKHFSTNALTARDCRTENQQMSVSFRSILITSDEIYIGHFPQ